MSATRTMLLLFTVAAVIAGIADIGAAEPTNLARATHRRHDAG
jgi:hypothetical protein